MRQAIGFIFFWISVGMLLMLLIENKVIGIIVVTIMMIIGYNLYCKK